ncbi:hypothetical protein IAE20_10195 [Acinetobacter sp. S54]|nr:MULTISPECIES: hypothetical protein [unclassified Acinetobacter]MBK0063989.1 hypothetical protein [Acinetobacter sp. S55]MBK0067274.1 hypothetical protein [Acinetobacter sp. S54]
MVSYAILGAALAYVNNGDPAAGGSAVVASEAAGIYFTKIQKFEWNIPTESIA